MYQSLMGEKHCRRIDKFDGNPAKIKSWMFDVVTACEYMEHDMAKDLKDQIRLRPKIDVQQIKFVLPDELTLNPTFDQSHQKYKGAFYLIVGLHYHCLCAARS